MFPSLTHAANERHQRLNVDDCKQSQFAARCVYSGHLWEAQYAP